MFALCLGLSLPSVLIVSYICLDNMIVNQLSHTPYLQLEALIANNGKDSEIQVSFAATHLSISYEGFHIILF